MTCHLFGAKQLPCLMLIFCKLDPREQTSAEFKYKTFCWEIAFEIFIAKFLAYDIQAPMC